MFTRLRTLGRLQRLAYRRFGRLRVTFRTQGQVRCRCRLCQRP